MEVIGNIIVRTLEKNNPAKKFFLHCQQLADVNNATIAKLFTTSSELLWTDGIRCEKVLLLFFVTNGATCMRKAAKKSVNYIFKYGLCYMRHT